MSVTLHTSLGDIKLEVFCDTAPRTSFNFLALCASGYYNGTIFHRNIPGFMIQGGSRKESSDNKKAVEDESIWGKGVSFDNEFHPNNLHEQRGVVSMANLQGPNTNRCQFFITYQRQAHLNHQYTVFGRVLDGWDVLDKMEALVPMSDTATADAADSSGKKKKKNLQFRPLHPPIIKAVSIHANPLADDYIVYPTPDGPPEKRV